MTSGPTGNTYSLTRVVIRIVKRAGKSRAGNWQLVSDNPDKQHWPTRPWPASAEVIGEVKWAARTF